MGKVNIPDLGPAVLPTASTEAQVARLTKLVHILWKEVERLETIVKFTQEEVTIKTGEAQLVMKKDGTILLKGHRINIATPGKSQIF